MTEEKRNWTNFANDWTGNVNPSGTTPRYLSTATNQPLRYSQLPPKPKTNTLQTADAWDAPKSNITPQKPVDVASIRLSNVMFRSTGAEMLPDLNPSERQSENFVSEDRFCSYTHNTQGITI